MRVRIPRSRVVLGALAAALVASAGGAALARAVSVSPMSVFMDHRTRTASITLYNPNPLPEEVEISFAFGYPQSDTAGEVTVPLSERGPEGEPSAVEWLRAFPRRVRLEPGQNQVVRILAQPPADLADGEYWSRVIVIATGGRPPVEQQVEPDVRVAITMRTVIIGSLNYRKGRLATGVTVDSSRADRSGTGAQLTLDLTRQGQAAYLGTIRVEALSADGRVLAEEEDVLSVYRTIRRRFAFPDTPGVASFRYSIRTERPDLGQSNIINAPAVNGSVEVR